MHTPVLLKQVIEGLQVHPGGKYIDATAGEGGHLKKILENGGSILAIDWDRKQMQSLTAKLQGYEQVIFASGNFAQIKKIAEKMQFYPVDGILFDLGLSMEQIARSGRGFSYKNEDELLDMRIGIRQKTTAEDIVNTLSEEQLYNIFAKYGEELLSRPIAAAIVQKRINKKLKTVADLTQTIHYVVRKSARPDQINKVFARIFQALRIIVNNELDNLEKALQQSKKLVKSGGRIVVISFHSLEDRVVKQFIRSNHLKTIPTKVIHSHRGLPYERSAKLRIIEIV